ncbi:TlpA family protein disulfide reductase [Sphingomonas sp. ID1715]|uniref:TlpA disulfide reductase family protein n=1 Tax=Sphingomonas sp. ID1715 TaxID=1656898 RepID=UPI0014891D49|nr:TlpA disulfide reductase family protein [Sphingomonas sp. ID1715]NNM78553.1 TlpA family protein disulfide reductase [Sphingomonas sp. ID1715]
MNIISIGPLLISGERLAAGGALWLFLVSAGLLERWSPRPLSSAALRALAIGLIGARLGYVAAHWEAFRLEPASTLFVWQGGFALGWGLAAAGAYLAIALRSLRAMGLAGLAGGVALATWLAASALLASRQTPTALPKIAAMRLDGTPVLIASHTGRPLVINLWATWCGPCRREMPMLVQAASARSDIDFVFLNQGEAQGVVRRYLQENGLPAARVAIDSTGDAGRRLDVAGFPTTLMIGADGLVRSTHIGEISRAALADELDSLLGHQSPSDQSGAAAPQ